MLDGHNDLAIMIRFFYRNKIYDKNFRERFEHGGLEFHVDIPRLRDGKSGGKYYLGSTDYCHTDYLLYLGAFWSAFVECPRNGTDFSDGNYVEG